MTVEPELTLTASPRTIDGAAQSAVIKLVAVDDKSKPGTGTVRVTSAAGSLKDGAEVTLAAGEGEVNFTCPRATDSACNNSVRITAEWVVSGKLVNATTSVTIAPALPVDAGTASLSVTANPTRFDINAGNTSTITATYLVDSVPAADASVTLLASLGTLYLVDGGTYADMRTDSAGQVRALLGDNGSPGTSTISASGPRSTQAMTTVRFDAVDAGPPMDGGYSVVLGADKNQIIAGVGDVAILTANLISVSNVSGLPVTFNTSVGRLGPVAGASVGSTYVTDTDDAGVARAQLLAVSSDMGQAMVSARVDGGAVSNNVTINIVTVSQISFVSTECPQTLMNCNLMGLQGSGFNETALVKFKVSDAAGSGVPGIAVNFALNGAPAGTTVDPAGVTNSMGEVRANVRSGRTIGTFTVTATALGGTFTVTSPTIGVRGAKPSNRGFTLRCDRVNIPVYASSTPPLPLMVNCQVGLSDRYGNPIGTGTQVRLNSEAGQVPNNVATTPFSPSVMNEGFGSFNFNTAINFPALDVPPLTANAAQYPSPLLPEPSVPGTIVRNPRDGLVSIIAYLQGEEDFKDDNANGTRDNNEQFIDQGEPFVDSNDNNQWDVGETFVDTPPTDGGMPNGQWDGPNNTWDSNAQIWTEYRLLYTGPTEPSNCVLTPAGTRSGSSSYGTLTLNGSTVLTAFTPDLNLNRMEGGSQVTARFQPQSRGTISVVNNSAGLDGYGFGYQRILVNPTGTGPCSTTEPICRWKVLFDSWAEGRVADVLIVGSAPPSMPANQTAIVETTVRGIVAGCGATGTVE